MKGDFSRLTFDPRKHYRSVRMQQGRVQLDADWNEQVDIDAHLLRTLFRDVVGDHGAPGDGDGDGDGHTHFRITVDETGKRLLIGSGRYYIDGVVCENESPVSLEAQPDAPAAQLDAPPAPTGGPASESAPASGDPPGLYLAYLHAFDEHVTALEDPGIREVALGGPDSGTRVRTTWQVKLQPTTQEEINALRAQPPRRPRFDGRPPRGRLRAFTEGGYSGVENQLYRVEIHRDSPADREPGFKWSRDNGSVALVVDRIEDLTLYVTEEDAAKLPAFRDALWVEVTSRRQLLSGQPGVLAPIDYQEDGALVVKTWPKAEGDAPVPAGPGPLIVRAWDGCDLERPRQDPHAKPVALRSHKIAPGLHVEFAAHTAYSNGDYWLIPARSATSDIEWPRDKDQQFEWREPAGMEHLYAPLAYLQRRDDGTWEILGDLRQVFTPRVAPLPGEVRILRVEQRAFERGEGERLDPHPRPLQDGGDVELSNLKAGLQLEYAGDFFHLLSRATCFVTVEVPGELLDPTKSDKEKKGKAYDYFVPITLATVADSPHIEPAEGNERQKRLLTWKASEGAYQFLRSLFDRMAPEPGPGLIKQLLGRWVLHGKSTIHRVEPSGPPGNSFEVWFWLVEDGFKRH